MNDYTNNHAWAYAVGLSAPATVLVWFSLAAFTWIIHDEAVGRPLVESMYRTASLYEKYGPPLRDVKAVAANSPGMDPAKRFKNRF